MAANYDLRAENRNGKAVYVISYVMPDGKTYRKEFASQGAALSWAKTSLPQGSRGPSDAAKVGASSDPSGANNAMNQGGAQADADYQRRVTEDAWRLLKGEWDPEVVPGREVIEAAKTLKDFISKLPGQAAPADTVGEDMSYLDDWSDLLGSLTDDSGGGGGGGAPAAAPEDPVDTPEEIKAYALANYPYLAAYMDDPELGPIIEKAAKEGWDRNRLRGALSATNWWKTTAESAREFDAERSMDPASHEQKIQQRVAEISQQAALMGIPLSGQIDLGAFGSYDVVQWLATTSLREGWTPEKITQAIFSHGQVNLDADQGLGMMGAQADQIKAMASSYMLPITDRVANDYARQILEGTLNADGVEAMFRDQAKGRYPGLASVIDQGMRPEQFFDTYKAQIGKLLEIDADSVDMMSAKWAPMVETVGQDGVRRPMTLSEAADFIRSQPEYDRTDNANYDAYRATELLGKTFGVIG